jgi:hypothetical protein
VIDPDLHSAVSGFLGRISRTFTGREDDMTQTMHRCWRPKERRVKVQGTGQEEGGRTETHAHEREQRKGGQGVEVRLVCKDMYGNATVDEIKEDHLPAGGEEKGNERRRADTQTVRGEGAGRGRTCAKNGSHDAREKRGRAKT